MLRISEESWIYGQHILEGATITKYMTVENILTRC